MSRYILAVDPGKTGSFAVIDSVRPVNLLHVRVFDAEFSASSRSGIMVPLLPRNGFDS